MEDWHLFLLENAQHCLPGLSALAPQHAGNKIGVCDIRYVRVHIISIYTYAFLNMTWGFDAEPETNINKPNPVLGMTISPCSLDGFYRRKKTILGSKKLSCFVSPEVPAPFKTHSPKIPIHDRYQESWWFLFVMFLTYWVTNVVLPTVFGNNYWPQTTHTHTQNKAKKQSVQTGHTKMLKLLKLSHFKSLPQMHRTCRPRECIESYFLSVLLPMCPPFLYHCSTSEDHTSNFTTK